MEEEDLKLITGTDGKQFFRRQFERYSLLYTINKIPENKPNIEPFTLVATIWMRTKEQWYAF
jgi:hypothetical protein